MIWMDYDKAGEMIAGDVVNLVRDIPYRLVGNEENIFTTYADYKKWLVTIQYAEQEMTLGGTVEWRIWIKQ